MRRLPIFFIIDVSDSMVGEPVSQVQDGMRTLIQNLRVDPYALETVFVSIIAFAGKAKVLSPLEELYKFYPPILPIGGGTSLGKALECLMDEMDSQVKITTHEHKGDWKPIVFLFTDGNPTDDYAAAFSRWNEKYRRHCNLVIVSIGDNVNALILGQLTENILLLRDTDDESFSQFFKWVTASIKTTSMSVSDNNSDELKLPPTSGINLEKVDPHEYKGSVDENFVVLHARCQNTKRDYLIKYANKYAAAHHQEYRRPLYGLVGAYPIDAEVYEAMSLPSLASINTMSLKGVPSCPCCGNQLGAVVCECGNIFCAGDSESITCPWCGMEGVLGNGVEGGMDISRGLG